MPKSEIKEIERYVKTTKNLAETDCYYFRATKTSYGQGNKIFIGKESFWKTIQSLRGIKTIDEAKDSKVKSKVKREIERYAKREKLIFLIALKEGNLPFQPRMGTKNNSFCDTDLALDGFRNIKYCSMDQIRCKLHQRVNNYKTGEYVTTDAAYEAFYDHYEKEDDFLSYIKLKKGTKPVFIMFKELGRIGFKPLYNIESFEKPEPISEFCVNMRANLQKRIKEKFPDKIQEYEIQPKSRDNGAIACKSTDTAALIGQWKAACRLGKEFKVTQEQNKEFVKKCENYLKFKSLQKLMDESDKYCKDFMPTVYQKKKPERAKASPGMGM